MKHTLTATIIIAVTTGAALADGLTYGYGSYDFSNYAFESNDGNISNFFGTLEYEVNQFLFSADIDRSVSSSDGDSTDTAFYSVGAAVKATPNILAGAGLTGTSDDGDDTTGFEVFGQYSMNQFGAALKVAKPSDAEDDVVTTLYGTYQATPDLSFGVSVRQNSEQDDNTRYELSADYTQGPVSLRGHYDGFSDADVGIFGFRGTYDVTPDIGLLAGYQKLLGDDVGFDLSGFRVGGGYKVAQTVWIDAFYGQVLTDVADYDRLGLQLTFETGARQRIDDTFAQNNNRDQNAGFGRLFNLGL